jgi:hypothetical protein
VQQPETASRPRARRFGEFDDHGSHCRLAASEFFKSEPHNPTNHRSARVPENKPHQACHPNRLFTPNTFPWEKNIPMEPDTIRDGNTIDVLRHGCDRRPSRRSHNTPIGIECDVFILGPSLIVGKPEACVDISRKEYARRI